MKYLGNVSEGKDLVTKEYLDSRVPSYYKTTVTKAELTYSSATTWSIPTSIKQLISASKITASDIAVYWNGILIKGGGVNYSLTNENFSVQFTPDVGDVFTLVAVTTDPVVET